MMMMFLPKMGEMGAPMPSIFSFFICRIYNNIVHQLALAPVAPIPPQNRG